jgi:hypothetical protein
MRNIDTYLNTNGAPPKTGMSAGDIGAIVETFGKITVEAIDASKRRKIDFNLNQQKLQAELGLAEKAQQQQYDIARLNLIAAQAGGKKQDDNKDKGNQTLMYIGIGVGALVLFGTIFYVIKNKKQ